MNSPRYVAIITDGNGRWARQRGLEPIEGHRAGADIVKARLRDAVEFGVRELTVFSFSTENWSRPRGEVEGLMAMFGERIDRETPELDEEGVRMRFVGRREGVPSELVKRMEWAEEQTRENDRITLFVAFNYGGRAEIVDAVKRIVAAGLDPEQITEDTVKRYLYTADLPDPDLVIRTAGEMRLSNFLIWQAAYSEYYSTPTLWPDFDEENLHAAVESYAARHRKFGKL